MLTYILKRFLSAIPTVFIVITISFFMMRLAPGGPFDSQRKLPEQVLENINKIYHLDKPLIQQYLIYFKNVMQGDFGPSYFYVEYEVTDLIFQGLKVSSQLGGMSLLVGLIGGLLLGGIAAIRSGFLMDQVIMSYSILTISIPSIVTAPVLAWFFGVYLGWLPAGGYGDGSFTHKILPVIVLAIPQTGAIASVFRSAMLEIISSPHVRTARAKGISEFRVMVRHVMRGALIPVVSLLGPWVAYLMVGSVIVESIFQMPGVGSFFINGALNRDYTLVMGTVVLFACLIVVLNLIVDILYALIDPKVRY